jgi:hypothetical protein
MKNRSNIGFILPDEHQHTRPRKMPTKPPTFDADIDAEAAEIADELLAEKHNFSPIRALAFVGCGAFTIFSFYSSALEYHNNLGNAFSAAIRTLGVQLCLVVFGALAVMQLFTVRRVQGLTKLGCACGAILACALTVFMFADSASTSYSYQDYILGKRTGDERALEASIHQYSQDLLRATERRDATLEQLTARRAELLEEKGKLDAIVGPAVKAGTNLKKGYSDSLAALTSQLRQNADQQYQANMGYDRDVRELDSQHSRESAQLRAANSSGASNVGRMLGISTSHVVLGRTLMCELALVALSIMFGVGLFYDRQKSNYMATGLHMLGFAIIFGIGWALFMAEVKAETREAPPAKAVEPVREGWDILLNTQPEAEENALPYTDEPEGLPQAAAFPGWDFEQLGEGRGLIMDIKHKPERYSQYRHRVASTMITRPIQGKPSNCPIPTDIYEAINELSVSPKVKSIIAGAGYIESTWNVNCHHDDNGGMSHGWLQLHGKWRKDTVNWMKQQPGGWRDARVNLAGFLRTLIEHQKYYPASRKNWRSALAHYNGGSRPNYHYADKAIRKARSLEQWFTAEQGRVF